MADAVNIFRFAECRAEEIFTLMKDVTSKEPKLSHQRLPICMRRRAASHNPKRVPRKLRMKISHEPSSKSKKKHKTHKKLLDVYNDRQNSDSVWLPTHIWFAKRFHMKKMWGYKLPMQATGKRFRASYRASTQTAIIQDLSYYCCIELNGEQEKLLSKLSSLTDDSLGLNFAAEAYIDGTREGNCFLYHPNAYPFKAIGPVSFLWRPLSSSDNDENHTLNRQLWIWCHPTMTSELIEVLINIFNLNEQTRDPEMNFEFASKTNYMKTKLHFQKEPIYSNGDITIVNLKDTLIRHRIIGPNALSIITNILHPRSDNEMQHDDSAAKNKKKSSNVSETILQDISAKNTVWKYLKDNRSAYYIPLRIVIGITVEDPRVYVSPNTFTDDDDVLGDTCSIDEFCNSATAISPLWNENARNEVTASQIPEFVINQTRGKYIVPNEEPELKKLSTGVPVILIHQPAINGYGSGFDIIAPQGWGMAFWIPFIHNGAQPTGIEDHSSMNFESGSPTFPLSFPDTKAGSVHEENLREDKLKQFHRYSRAKRPNFEILGIKTPFFMPWKVLVNNWKTEFLQNYSSKKLKSSDNCCTAFRMKSNTENNEAAFFTVRSKEELNYLQRLCTLLHQNATKNDSAIHLKSKYNSLINNLLVNQNGLKSIVLIHVKCISRGTPSKFSGVYLPTEADLAALKENSKYFGPNETNHSTENDSSPAKKRKLLKEQAKIKDLSRPEVNDIMFSDRKIIGYVMEGGYSRLGSQGYAVGHCALIGLLSVFEICMKCQLQLTVLIRNQDSSQYRMANAKIINL